MPRIENWVSSVPKSLGLVNQTESICENEEFEQIMEHQRAGVLALSSGNGTLAVCSYSEALEIDEANADSLTGRCVAFLLTDKIEQAWRDAIVVKSLDPKNPRGYYLESLCFEYEQKYEKSLGSLLAAVNMRTSDDCLVCRRILIIAKKCLSETGSVQLLHEEDEEDDVGNFQTLLKAGRLLLAAEKSEKAAEVLQAAMRCDDKRTEVDVARLMLVLGKSLAASRKFESAILSFKDCLRNCGGSGDVAVRVEALSNLADSYTRIGDSLLAITSYEKLNAMLQGDEGLNTLLGPEFLSGMCLNLSLAYRSVSELKMAECHARRAILHSEGISKCFLHSCVLLNLGILSEVSGRHHEALVHFDKYRKSCKDTKDLNGLALAYGCLANVYAQLNRGSLATALHDHQILLAENSGRQSLLALAKEMEGDSFVFLKNFPASIRSFQQMLRYSEAAKLTPRADGYFKLGKVYLHSDQKTNALCCFERGLSITEEYDIKFPQLRTRLELGIAGILKDSEDQEDLERAEMIYSKMLKELEQEFFSCPYMSETRTAELRPLLEECDYGLVCVLLSLLKEREALFHIERLNFLLSSPGKMAFDDMMKMDLKEEYMILQSKWIADHLRSTVIYYFVLPKMLVIWVICPGEDPKFFKQGLCNNILDMSSELSSLIASCFAFLSAADLMYACENRAIQLNKTNKNMEEDFFVEIPTRVFSGERILDFKRPSKNQIDVIPGYGIGQPVPVRNISLKAASVCENNMNLSGELNEAFDKVDKEFPLCRLYDFLIAPIEAALQNSQDTDDRIVIIPGSLLCRCPFWTLTDKNNIQLGWKYRVTVASSLSILRVQVKNTYREEESVLNCENCEVQKTNCSSARNYGSDTLVKVSDSDDLERINPKRTSNPRLASLRSFETKTSLGNPSVGSLTTPMNSTKARNLGILIQGTSDLEEVSFAPEMDAKMNCVVIGCPSLPNQVLLHGNKWQPIIEESRMKSECLRVAHLLGVDHVSEREATKERFLREMKNATILHITTLVSAESDGLILSPNPTSGAREAALVDETLYLVMADEILATGTSAKLVVLSGGWSTISHTGLLASHPLVSAFLAAGAHCVLVVTCAIPSRVLTCFYEEFYAALLRDGQISSAFQLAINHFCLNDSFNSSGFSSAFALMGADTSVDLNGLVRAMALQSIATVRKETAKDRETEQRLPGGAEAERKMLQKLLASLLLTVSFKSKLFSHLVELLEDGIASTLAASPPGQVVKLSDDVCQNTASVKLLRFLGFFFQPPEGADISRPYTLLPISDDRGLLSVCLEALRTLKEIATDVECLRRVQQLLPLSPQLSVRLHGLFSIFYENPDEEMSISDSSHSTVVWQNTKVRSLMMSLGFQSVGSILHFRNSFKNRSLLSALLKLISTLAPDLELKTSPSQMIACAGWIKGSWGMYVEKSAEMDEKMKLSLRVKEELHQYRSNLTRAKTWHQAAAASQARQSVKRKSYRPFVGVQKVKVRGGSTPSQTRIPVDREEIVDLMQTEQRRDYARYIYNSRLNQVKANHREAVGKLMLPYLERFRDDLHPVNDQRIAKG